MDSNIRKLVHAASQDNNESALFEAYKKLKKERQSSDDKIDAVSSDLFVLCAEAAQKVRCIISAVQLERSLNWTGLEFRVEVPQCLYETLNIEHNKSKF